MAIGLGDQIPDLTLPSTSGEMVSLGKFKGKKVVLYFYPKDDTPGCTKEACGFRDLKTDFERHNAVILGVSKDSVASHQKFSTKYKLPFDLLSDSDGKLSEAFGVWQEKSFMGKKYMGIVRSTFLIDENGKIIKEWRNLKVPGHMEDVLAELKN
ncbi:MAG: thioredoxin-dependent thiol peroxidase [Patescibacteria group bacterium]